MPEKLNYKACHAVGFAQSKDGLKWEALPPPPGETHGEVGGIEKIANRYYMTIGAGEVFVADKPEGPFLRQKKNPNMLGDSAAYYSRFFHTAPGGPLVHSFYMQGVSYSSPFKAVDVDAEGILRLTWWKGNETLKEREVPTSFAAESPGSPFVRFLQPTLPLDAAWVVEASLALPEDNAPTGFYLDCGDGTGQVVLFTRQGTTFGKAALDGSGRTDGAMLTRDLEWGPRVKVRLLMKKDIIEIYANEYLMNSKRMKCNGRIGLVGKADPAAVRDIQVWTEK